jgi:hypothetical protein
MQDSTIKPDQDNGTVKARNRILYFAMPLLLILLIIIASPVFKARQLGKIVYSDSTFTANYSKTYEDTAISKLVRDKAFRGALLALSEDDSINMILNINDSTLSLAIHGVIIHQTRLSGMRVDFFVRKMPQIFYVKFFSSPLKIVDDYATIVKVPLVEKEAPRDTLEAMMNAAETPDTLIHDPAFAMLGTDNGFQIVLEQEENPKLIDKAVKLSFYMRRAATETWHAVKSVFSLSFDHYTPTFRIKLPAGDLRAVYRALPTKPYVVVYYNP